MRFPWFFFHVLVTAIVVHSAGCATMHQAVRAGTPPRAAVDTPGRFLVVTATPAREPQPDEGCRNPLVDPRDGTRLTLVRSANGQGDYEPRPLRYGVKEGELLRVECASGRAVGIVK